MAGTKQFITASVGVKGKNNKNDVLALQQLLVAAGENVIGGADGGWGDNTRNALQSFLRAQTPAVDKAYIENAIVAPGEPVLLKLAEKAKILIPLPGKTGIAGIEEAHKWFVDNGIPPWTRTAPAIR